MDADVAAGRGPADPDLGGISLVLPVHNEALIIEETLRDYVGELAGRVPELEVVVAEDGSTDDTKKVLGRLAAELPIRLFMSDRRKGYQRAVADAVGHATQPWVFIVDSDYQFDAVDFWRLEPHRREHDVVLGMKSPRRDPLHRIWLSRGYNFLLRRAFRVPYRDMDTGFRLIRREIVQDLAPQVRHMSFFTAEFVIRAHVAGHRILEVPVAHYARKAGATTIFYTSHLLVICLRQLAGMWRMRRELKRRGILSARG